MGWVSQATEKVSEAATQVLQPVEKAISQGVTDLGRTIANSPVLEGTITAIAAAYGVPPALTAGFLAANKTSQTGGNLEKGLETFILSYGAGELTKSFKAVDLSTPAKAAESVSTAETTTQAAAQAQAQAAAAQAASQAAATTVVPAATTGGLLSGASTVPALTPAALESLVGSAGYGVNAAAAAAAPTLGIPLATVGSGALAGAGLLGGVGLTPAAVTPAVTTPTAIANQAVASGMGPGALGATTAATTGLTAAQLAAASGTVGAGSALEGLATLGNTSALTNLLSQGSSIGSTLSNLLPSASTVSSFLPSLLTGTLQGLGAANTAEKAREAAQIQADAQIKAAQIAADAAKFRPVGVTTRFGASNFTTDAQGNVIGAGYTASPEIKAYQDRLSALAAQGLTGAEGAQAAYAPLTAGAQSLFNLGQGYIQQTPEQQAADYIAKQQALLAPGQEQQLAQLQNRLLAQGRGGLSVAQGGTMAATSPELAAYYNALAQSNLQLAAQGQQAGQQQAQFGAGLLGAGSDLMGKYYAGQTAAYAPFATAMDTTTGLENIAQQPLTLGMNIGGITSAASANAGKLLSQGMINSAGLQAPANAFSYSGNLLSQAANNPQLQAAILKAFST